MAPEVLCVGRSALEVMGGYDERCDVYSFGLLLWEVAHRAVPFTGVDGIRVALSLAPAGDRPPLTPARPPSLAAVYEPLAGLIAACWHGDAAQRPSMAASAQELGRLLQLLAAARATSLSPPTTTTTTTATPTPPTTITTMEGPRGQLRPSPVTTDVATAEVAATMQQMGIGGFVEAMRQQSLGPLPSAAGPSELPAPPVPPSAEATKSEANTADVNAAMQQMGIVGFVDAMHQQSALDYQQATPPPHPVCPSPPHPRPPRPACGLLASRAAPRLASPQFRAWPEPAARHPRPSAVRRHLISAILPTATRAAPSNTNQAQRALVRVEKQRVPQPCCTISGESLL